MKALIPNSILNTLASRYVWWEPVEWAYRHPDIFIATVLNIGTWDDVELLRNVVSDKLIINILRDAPPGIFTPRSWNYWNLKFNIEPVPPLPKRKFQ